MSPSYSVKTGVRYRFYVSAALLRGRKSEAGSLTRVSATQIEQAVLEATRQRAPANPESTPNALIETFVERIEIGRNRLKITFKDMESSERPEVLELPWSTASSNLTSIEECPSGERQPDQKLIETLARGHSWVRALSDGTHTSIEQLAKSVRLHPNIVRQGLRAAFLAPDITKAILSGEQPAGLTSTKLLQIGDLDWMQQREAFAGTRFSPAKT